MVRVRGASGEERGHGAGLADAFLEYLAVFGLVVRRDGPGIHRPVALPFRRKDAGAGKETVHAEGARLVRHDGHDVAADALVPEQPLQHPHHRHGGGHFALA